MLKEVAFADKIQAKDFLKFALAEQKQELLHAAKALKGKKVVHVNATAKGGGVAQLLISFIPYLRALGIDASWYAIDSQKAGSAFFDFTNRLHNALQGSPQKFSQEEWNRYLQINKRIAKELNDIACDILVIHDPQPLAAAQFLKKSETATMCVIHIDTSTPDPVAWKKVFGFMEHYDRVVFSNRNFANKDIPKKKLCIAPPAIDPLASKQRVIPTKRARTYLAKYGIPKTGPLLVQVSRFDVWKNPHGVLEAFWLLQKKYPSALLALVGFEQARDNPQAERVYMDMRAMGGKSPNIFLFFDPKKIGGVEYISEFTTMAQNAADIVIQNSIKEGFGLTVAEAMWKEKPVIGGPASGIRKQIEHGKNGYIAPHTKALVKHADYLLSHAALRKRIGKKGKETVRKKFLLPRFVLDHLQVYKALSL